MIFSIKLSIAGVAQLSHRYCDGHHEMSDFGAACELVHTGRWRSPGGLSSTSGLSMANS
jgi:hypothetical protein